MSFIPRVLTIIFISKMTTKCVCFHQKSLLVSKSQTQLVSISTQKLPKTDI